MMGHIAERLLLLQMTSQVPSPAVSAGPKPRLAFALAVTVGLALVPAALAAAPRGVRPVAVIGLADGQAERFAAIGEAGGAVLAAAGPRITIAVPGSADFTERLRERGYWFIVDAEAVQGCLPVGPERRKQ